MAWTAIALLAIVLAPAAGAAHGQTPTPALDRGQLVVGLSLELKAWEIRRHGELSHLTLAVSLGTINRKG